MASPQLENGYVKIAHELFEALMRTSLSSQENQVLRCIIRKTYGFGKKTDHIPLKQFKNLTGIDRRNAHRALKRLEQKKIIVVSRDDKYRPKYGIQKDYSKWPSSIQMTNKAKPPEKTTQNTENPTVVNPDDVVCTDDKVSSEQMTNLSSVETPSIDNTKEKKERGRHQFHFQIKVPLPNNLNLTDPMKAKAVEWGMDEYDMALEFEKFCSWHKARESKFKDWQEAWRNWVLKWASYRKEHSEEDFDAVFARFRAKHEQTQ
jgi:phage replication O-like protein O